MIGGHLSYGLSLSAAAMLVACGGSASSIERPGAMVQTRAIATHQARSGSWMLPEAKGDDLLYAVIGCGGVCVFSYPSGKQVGSLGYQNVGFTSLCSDAEGNVFVLGYSSTKGWMVFEYAHGGTVPISTLQIDALDAFSCAVDPTTGNLAVVFGGWATQDYPDGVAIFANGSGTPTLFGTQDLVAQYSGYDAAGNLFVDGRPYRQSKSRLAELAAGATSFTSMATDIKGTLGQIQWDGKRLTIEAFQSHSINRVSVSGNRANLLGSTILAGAKHVALSWIEGQRVVSGYSTHAAGSHYIGLWPYPSGKKLRRIVAHGQGFTKFYAVTVSAAPSR